MEYRPSKWDIRYMEQAKQMAKWSKDRSTLTCAIIVKENRIVSTGINGFPNNVNDNIDERHERPAKYLWTEHAERNAIYSAAKFGIATGGCTMYVMWFPCAPCARAIIQSGIKRLVCFKPDKTDKKWGDDFVVAEKLLEESGVEINFI